MEQAGPQMLKLVMQQNAETTEERQQHLAIPLLAVTEADLE